MTRKPDYSFIVLSSGRVLQEAWTRDTARYWSVANTRNLTTGMHVAHRIRVYLKPKAAA